MRVSVDHHSRIAGIASNARGVGLDVQGIRKVRECFVNGPFPVLSRNPGPPGRGRCSREGSEEHESGCTFRVGSGEQRGHGTTLRSPVDGGAFTASSIHDGSDVVHPLLERGNANVTVGHPGAPFVKEDQSAERCQALHELCVAGIGQLELEVAVDPGHPDQVDGTVADDLVGDAHLAASGVPGLRGHPSRMPGQRFNAKGKAKGGPAEGMSRRPLAPSTAPIRWFHIGAPSAGSGCHPAALRD